MVGFSQSHVQQDILRVLFDRATSGKWTDASLTRPRISELLGYKIAPAMLQIHLDELADQKLVQSPKRGVRDRFQLTAEAIREYDSRTDAAVVKSAQSEAWTGNLDREAINEARSIKICHRIKSLQLVLDGAALTNEERAQAGAYVAAAVTLSEAPEPPWEVIKTILLLLASISTVFVAAIEIAKLIN